MNIKKLKRKNERYKEWKKDIWILCETVLVWKTKIKWLKKSGYLSQN